LKVAVNFRRSLLLIGQEIRLRPIPVQFFPTTSQGVCPRQFEQLLERNTALLKIVSERIDTLTALVARLRK
jgi:hypothetical protein